MLFIGPAERRAGYVRFPGIRNNELEYVPVRPELKTERGGRFPVEGVVFQRVSGDARDEFPYDRHVLAQFDGASQSDGDHAVFGRGAVQTLQIGDKRRINIERESIEQGSRKNQLDGGKIMPAVPLACEVVLPLHTCARE